MQQIEAQKDKLDALFEKARKMSEDAELLSHWAKYLCILVCGFLENSVEACLVEYSKQHGDENLHNFISKQIRSFQNPKMGKILELFGSFNKTWEDDLKKQLDGQISDAVNSIVSNRNLIAHGDSSQLSMSALKNYYSDAVKGVKIMEEIVTRRP